MLTLKKMIITLSSITSGIVFAGTMGPVCSPEHATIPCEARAWDVGVEALYLKAVYNGVYAFSGRTSHFTETFSTNLTTTTENYHYIDSPAQWGFGFKLFGSYHFSTGKELSLNWSHYSKTGSVVNNVNNVLGNYTNEPARSTVKPQWDAVNLEFGQHVNLGEQSHLRYHGGVQYARIKGSFNDIQLRSSSSLISNDNSLRDLNTTVSKTYNGFGPRLGADLSYDLPHAFGVYAKGATVLLIGTQKTTFLQQSIETEVADQTTTINIQRLDGSNSALVPELEASLGITYDHPLSSGNLTLNLGYMWLNYFNASNFIGDAVTSNFALHGVNFGVKWLG